MAHVPKQITEMFAWIVRERDGGDGVPALLMPNPAGEGPPMLFPLMGSDRERMESLRVPAMQLAGIMPLRLVRFTNMDVLETHGPDVDRQ
jgi:hypothetical protein